MKQTAVEWLEEMIAKMEAYGGDLPPLMVHIKKAKEMEKQQKIEMFDKGFDSVEQLNDEYAIEFLDWVLDWFIDNVNKQVGEFTIKELLEIFKKEKGL